MTMTALGIGIGFIGAVAITKSPRSMLVGVSSYDPLTFVAAAFAIIVVALLAGLIPARRALSVSTLVALQGAVPSGADEQDEQQPEGRAPSSRSPVGLGEEETGHRGLGTK